MLKRTKITLLASAIAISPFVSAGIDDQMRDAFGVLMNTTNPSAYNTARRGVISGGSLFMKAPIKRANIASATAPSFSAGCGGISLYGGSFSFINADEFIQTFQAVGANALGYGVKLAVQSACPTCEQIMTSLEKTAQFINSMNVDSCQAAQGIVNAGVDFAKGAAVNTEAKTYGVNSGQWSDLNEAWGWYNESGKSPTKEIADANPTETKKRITINATWKAMKEANVQNVFGADNSFLELLMTMIGTVVIKNPATDPKSDAQFETYAGNTITLNQLIDGGTFSIYNCGTSTDSEGCLSLSQTPSKSITIKGMRERVYESLMGSDGVIKAYMNDTDWSDLAKKTLNFPTMIGEVCNKAIYQSATAGTAATIGTQIASTCSERMALELAYMQVAMYINTVQSALDNLFTSTAQAKAKESAQKLLTDSLTKYQKEYERLSKDADYLTIKAKLDSITLGEGNVDNITGK
ncbi:conjugal transfer protein TraH [Vibrio navarrensis]|nr:conjugal transfer protein TraH [Vibrio navarrensis]